MDLLLPVAVYYAAMIAENVNCFDVGDQYPKPITQPNHHINIGNAKNIKIQTGNRRTTQLLLSKKWNNLKNSVSKQSKGTTFYNLRNFTKDKHNYTLGEPIVIGKKDYSNATKLIKFEKDSNFTLNVSDTRQETPLLYKIHATLTRSKDAIWATITLTFMCIVLLLAVAQSRMWKDYHGSDMHDIPLPNFNERVPFKEVMQRKVAILREMLAKGKKKKKNNMTELESLLMNEESDDEQIY